MLKAYIEQFLGTPYEFPSYHKAIREPYDYYQVTYIIFFVTMEVQPDYTRWRICILAH
jgi:hypothetical protein